VINVSNAHLIFENCTFNVTAIGAAPWVNIIYPSEDEVVNGTIIINGSAGDDPPGWVETVKVKIDDGPWDNATSFNQSNGEWSYEWNTTTVENGNGEYTIRARAIDNEGYSSPDSKVTVIVNNSGVNWRPNVEILSPKDKIVSGIVTISGTASDKDGSVEKVEISIDGDEWQEIEGTAEWSHEWDTSNILFGIVTISARSYDGEHYSSIVSIDVIVMNNISGALEIRLLDASVEITNLNMSGPNNGTINVGYFYVSGGGYISLNTDRDRAEGEPGDPVNSGSYITVEGSASLTSLVITDCYLFIPEELLPSVLPIEADISFNADLSLAGAIYINATWQEGLEDIYLELSIDQGSLSITNVYIEINDGLLSKKGVMAVDTFYLEGSGALVLDEEGIEIDANIVNLTVSNFKFGLEIGDPWGQQLTWFIVNGSFDLSSAGHLFIKANLSYLEFELGCITGGNAYVDISNFGWIRFCGPNFIWRREITFPGQLRISHEGSFALGALVDLNQHYGYIKLDVHNSSISWDSDLIIIKSWISEQEILNLSIEGGGQIDIEGDMEGEFIWNGNLSLLNVTELTLRSNRGFSVSAEFLKITVNQHELVRFEVNVTVLGDITVSGGENSYGVKYVRVETAGGFEGNIQRIGFGGKTIELDIHMEQGSSFELQNSSALDDGLDARVDLLFDGDLTINKFKETI